MPNPKEEAKTIGTGLSILGVIKVKMMNLLPTLLVPVIFYGIKGLFGVIPIVRSLQNVINFFLQLLLLLYWIFFFHVKQKIVT